jgi:pimeloyl-ACP methyl ester carboxylesterase
MQRARLILLLAVGLVLPICVVSVAAAGAKHDRAHHRLHGDTQFSSERLAAHLAGVPDGHQGNAGKKVDKKAITGIRPEALATLDDCGAQWGGPFLCGTINVPVSKANPSLGTRVIDFIVRPADVQPAKGTTLFSNGADNSTFSESSPWKAGYFSWIAAARGAQFTTRDIILVNTRGTGRDAVDCPLFQGDGNDMHAAIAECVGILGPAIDYFTFADSAEDLESVRSFLMGPRGKVDIVTIGHQSAQAEAYVARYAKNVRSMVLDGAEGFTAWGEKDVKEWVRITDQQCRNSARCAPRISDTTAEIAWLARELRKQPLVGVATLPDGSSQNVVLDEKGLAWNILGGGDDKLDVLFYGSVGAAIRAYRDGDPAPLLRLAAMSDVTNTPPSGDVTSGWGPLDDHSGAEWAASSCNEWPMPYDLTASESVRRSQANARLALEPSDLFGVFSKGIAADGGGSWAECWGWPAPTRVNRIHPTGAPYADVPILFMTGDMNPEHVAPFARELATRYPRGTFVSIPRAANPALAYSSCAGRIAANFLDTLKVGDTTCNADEGDVFSATGAYPVKVKGETAADIASGADRSRVGDRRVASAAVHTWIDALHLVFYGNPAGVGLRGGSWEFTDGAAGTWVLDGAKLVSDVSVSGTVQLDWASGEVLPSDLTVSGPGTADGVVHIEQGPIFGLGDSTVHVTGQIGGRALDLTVAIH